MSRRADDHKWADHNTLVGYTEKRGHGYHFYGTESNSYPGAVPVEEINRRLLNWTAEESPLFVNLNQDTPNERQIQVPGQKALVASDNGEILGIHGENRPTRQYDEMLIDSVRTLLDVDELGIGSVGFLNGRRRMWMNIEMAETLEVPDTGVQFRPYMLVAASHDASIKWTFKMLNELIICGNMVAPRLRLGGRQETAPVWKIKNTRHSGLDVQAAREALGILHSNSEEFMEEVAALISDPVSDRQWSKLLDVWAPVPTEEDASKRAITVAENKRETLTQLWNADPMVSPWKGTAFGAFQAMNTYQHHHQGTRGTTRAERNLERAVDSNAKSVENMDFDTLDAIARVLVSA